MGSEMTNETGKNLRRGRKQLSPLEALYYRRVQVTLLLGIYIGRKGETLSECIDILEARFNFEKMTPRQRITLTNALNQSIADMRGLIKDMGH
jgi:hypothetical protein